MLFSKNIRHFVSGILFFWVLATLAPSIAFMVNEEPDSIELSSNMEEDPSPSQEEEKKENKKDWGPSHFGKTQLLVYPSQNAYFNKNKQSYMTPSHEVVLPPPEWS